MPTLCLAIKASDWDRLRFPGSIVLCMDSLGSNNFTSTEHVRKIEWLPHGFIALVAGPVSTARELADVIREQMQAGVSGAAQLLQKMRIAISVMKHRFADAYVGARLGIDYRKFQKTGREAFPDDLYRQTAWDVSTHRLGVELIVAGFVPRQDQEREPVIVKLSEEEEVTTCDAFATIGSGSLLAQASLMQRDYSSISTIEYATYLAYEAKRLGERAPGVGRETSIMVMVDGPNGPGFKELLRDQLSTLEELFKQFGPQPITDTKVMQLPQNAWYPEGGSDPQ